MAIANDHVGKTTWGCCEVHFIWRQKEGWRSECLWPARALCLPDSCSLGHVGWITLWSDCVYIWESTAQWRQPTAAALPVGLAHPRWWGGPRVCVSGPLGLCLLWWGRKELDNEQQQQQTWLRKTIAKLEAFSSGKCHLEHALTAWSQERTLMFGECWLDILNHLWVIIMIFTIPMCFIVFAQLFF